MKIFKLLAVTILPMLFVVPMAQMQTAEAPTSADAQGFLLTNGFCPTEGGCTPGQEQAFFNANLDIFDDIETNADGLGPVFNNNSCAACHNLPVTGGFGHTAELRAGNTVNGVFTPHPGDSLIHSSCINAACTEHILGGNNTRALRSSLPLFGLGFVEATANQTLQGIRNAQAAAIQGVQFAVPVEDVANSTRIGRFGWKAQQASLETFSQDAYLNEMGITSNNPDNPAGATFRTDNRSNGNVVNDGVADPEDDGEDIEAFTSFMRSLRAPAPGPQNADATTGSNLFNQIGCAGCHVRSITTAQPGTAINGGAEVVGNALGNKVYHPFSDFLLHDIGVGDGIVQNGGAGSRNAMRTMPLWGLRYRNRFFHDLNTFTFTDAINRHAGQATASRNAFNALTAAQRAQVVAFLNTL